MLNTHELTEIIKEMKLSAQSEKTPKVSIDYISYI